MPKKILHVIPYKHLYPPMNGGMLRCFHILNQLSKYYDLTILSYVSENELKKASSKYPSIQDIKIEEITYVPSQNRLKKLLQSIWYKWKLKSIIAPSSSDFLVFHQQLKRLLKNKSFDFILLENINLAPLAHSIKRWSPSSKIIYNAHNVDSKLIESSQRTNRSLKKSYKTTKKIESNLYKNLDLIWTCSENDLNTFRELNFHKVKGFVVPNGVEIQEKPSPTLGNNKIKILFCGTIDYSPNQEGLKWFFKNVWQYLNKNFQIEIVGKGKLDEELKFLFSQREINYIGEVEDVIPYYEKATLAIVPLLSGSGTRLKVLEAMANFTPVISTSKGAEGIIFVPEKHLIIADKPEDFAKAIHELISNKEKRELLQINARTLAKEKYSWDKIGVDVKNILGNV
jgi:glycosyltransferase involved in cell wall biosynthesis